MAGAHLSRSRPQRPPPAIYKAPSEVSAAIGAYTRHCGASERATAQAEARAAVAALQSPGHLMTEPLPTHESDRVLASTLGLPMGELTLPQLTADWAYHARTAPPPSGEAPTDPDTSTWPPSMVGTLENPTRSSLFRAPPLDTRPPPPAGQPERPQSSVRNWNLRSITRVPPLPTAAAGLRGRKRLTSPPTGRYAAVCATATRVRTLRHRSQIPDFGRRKTLHDERGPVSPP